MEITTKTLYNPNVITPKAKAQDVMDVQKQLQDIQRNANRIDIEV